MEQTAFLHVDFKQPEEMEFNRARLRRAFVQIGRVYMRDARRLVMRRGRSAPGENPGYQTGRLARSIGYYVPRKSSRRSGLMVRISPNQKNGQGNRRFPEGSAYYPAFLYYGVRHAAYGMSKKDKRQKKQHSSRWRLAPRNNFMVETLEKNRSWTRYFLARELRKSLKPERRHR
ncbi:putative phage protein [Escherichia coli]|nr:putative phage protein [Escherichia coli]SQR12012.1 phage protein [Escherichia coli]STE29123.1 phage protein [Escherichia coli]